MAKKIEAKELICGIVMPISPIDGCDAAHWLEVKEIISDAVDASGYKANLVSEADDVGIIQARIVQNLYDNEIVVCDVSGKNPNVMFELGLRLAFDKPTIIVKDNKTSYMFDTGQVEHIEYPRDLRFSAITDFKKLLSEKIKATVAKSKLDPNYSTFLKHFGKFKIASLGETEVSGQEYLLEEMRLMRRDIQQMRHSTPNRNRQHQPFHRSDGNLDFCLRKVDSANIEFIENVAKESIFVENVSVKVLKSGHSHLTVELIDDAPYEVLRSVETDISDAIQAMQSF